VPTASPHPETISAHISAVDGKKRAARLVRSGERVMSSPTTRTCRLVPGEPDRI
jgi:hypothetical protein